jgi:hypothetical protein
LGDQHGGPVLRVEVDELLPGRIRPGQRNGGGGQEQQHDEGEAVDGAAAPAGIRPGGEGHERDSSTEPPGAAGAPAVIDREVVRHLRTIPDTVARLELSDTAAAAATLDRLEQDAAAAIDALREVTHGLYPAMLAHRGLAATLRGHAGRTGRSATLTIGTDLADRRFPEHIETAAYFCAAALLPEAESVSLSTQDGWLVVAATGGPEADDAVVDRAEAAGGRTSQRVGPDGRYAVRVEFPLQPSAASAQTAASRSVPNEDLAR